MDIRSLKPTIARYFPIRLLQELRIEFEGAAQHFASRVIPRRAMSLSRARRLRDIKLMIGAGDIHDRDGWYTIDFRSAANFQIDIRRGLPFADRSCRFIFSEHVFEHLDMEELRRVASECYRVLEPGGVMRIVTPDLEKWARAYVANDEAFFHAFWPGMTSFADAINEIFYVPTHRFIHDFRSLSAELTRQGFSPVHRSAWRESSFSELNLDAEWAHRRLESLYIEAVRPPAAS
jgi:predicted SAM-dependent methyltransferase